MAIFEFNESDLLRNKLAEPAWYVLFIEAHRDWTPSKAGDSNNCFYETVIEKNADTGDTTYAGVPIEIMFNDKPRARGFIEGFLRALGVEVTSGKKYDGNSAVGRRIEAFVENNEWQGRISNKASNKFRQYRG